MEPFSRDRFHGVCYILHVCVFLSSFFFNLLASFAVYVFLSFNQGGQWGSPGGPRGSGVEPGGPEGAQGGQAQTQGAMAPLAPPLATGLHVIIIIHNLLRTRVYNFLRASAQLRANNSIKE